jgi:NADPH:quinone reductase-like Zn-dependent oxidoreductase
MRGVFFRKHGGTEVLEYGELPDPRPAAGEVLVAVEHVSLNHVDLLTRNGWPGIKLDLPHVPGCDGAGRVVELGDGVTRFAVGDPVVVYPNLSDGECEACLAGLDNQCRQWQLLGEHVWGTFRERITLPQQNLLKIPADFPPAAAAAAALVFLTAWHSLITRGRVRPGEVVLVVGASGGVNTASIQIAKLAGATVLVVGSNPEKLSIAEGLGADLVIDRSSGEDWSKQAYLAHGRRGVDVVVDNVGAPTLSLSLRAARKGGRILTVGNSGGAEFALDNRLIFGKHLSILGSTMGTRSEFATVMGLLFQGRLRPVLDRAFPLAEAAAAFARMEAGEQRGKITLTVG